MIEIVYDSLIRCNINPNNDLLQTFKITSSEFVIKSKYLENKTVEFFERIFPKKNMFTNIYYWQDGIRHETDLLIKYDDKIFIIESKSGNLPDYALQTGKTALKQRLKELMDKSAEQAIAAKNYIIVQKNAKFWDMNKQNILLEMK